MRGYQVTARGWALVVVLLCLLALLVFGGFKLISTLAAEEGPSPSEDEPSPSEDFRVTPSGGPSPSVSPEDSPTGIPSPPTPTASAHTLPPATPTPSPTPIVIITPPPYNPPQNPTTPQSTPTPTATPAPTPSPTPAYTPDYPPEPTFEPTPTPEPPDWARGTLSVLFLWNSDEMAEPELVLEDIYNLMPPDWDLAEYIVLIEGYASDDEPKPNLALMRAEVLETLFLEELELDPSCIRVEAVTDPDIFDRKRQRADISFRYVGNK